MEDRQQQSAEFVVVSLLSLIALLLWRCRPNYRSWSLNIVKVAAANEVDTSPSMVIKGPYDTLTVVVAGRGGIDYNTTTYTERNIKGIKYSGWMMRYYDGRRLMMLIGLNGKRRPWIDVTIIYA